MTFIIALLFSLAQSAPYIVIGYLVAAGIKEFVPVGMLTRHFGEKGVRPLFHALGIGLILPICSCGVIPLGVGAFKCGSARGTTLTFMTSAPTVAPVAMLLSISLLGVQFTASYVAIALLGSLLIGLLGNWLLGGKAEAEFRASRNLIEAGEQLQDSTHRTLSTKLIGALRWAFWDLGSDVSIDLLFGIALAAAILAFVPVDWISSWLGRQSFVTLFYVILVAIPLYTCSTPSIPVVQSLLLKGISPGAAVAYLIAGPATNIGEIAAIKRSMGKGAAALFVAGLISVALLGGMVVDFLIFPHYLPKTSPIGSELIHAAGEAPSLSAAVDAIPAWHYPFIVMLIVTLLLGAFRRGLALFERFASKQIGTHAAVSVAGE